MNLALVGAFSLFAQTAVVQDGSPESVLAKYDLKPNLTIAATNGKATLGEGETIELIGACDLAKYPSIEVWNSSGRLLDAVQAELFWKVMDLPERPNNLRKDYSLDPEHRTFAMAFRLSASLTEANDVREDVNKTFAMMLSQTRPLVGTGASAYVGEMRIIKPILPKEYTGSTFDFRLEVPGGSWTTLAEFPFGKDTTFASGAIDIKMRWQAKSEFKMIDDRQTLVEYKAYFFTVQLPSALRDVELEIVTNDPLEDEKLLQGTAKQHLRGEDYGAAYKGKDLFAISGLTSRSEARKFTLRARPKRIVEFKAIPFKRN